MPGYNGSGTYQRFRSWEADAAAGVKIRADYHDTEDNGFAAGLSNAICRDGQSTITANIPFNAKRITGLANPVDAQDAVTKAWLLDQGLFNLLRFPTPDMSIIGRVADGGATPPTKNRIAYNDKVDGTGNDVFWINDDGTVSTKDVTTGTVYAMARKTADTRNRIVNGAMQISQENGDAGSTLGSYYPADQWQVVYSASGASLYIARTASVAGLPNGSRYTVSLGVVTPKPSLAAGDYIQLFQNIEGTQIADFKWGTASAKQAILRFWVYGSTGTYTVRIANGGDTRSFLAPFTITTLNVWEEKTIVIPGDTTGTWATDTGKGIAITLVPAAGSSLIGVAGWQGSAKYGLAGQSNLLSAGNSLYVADVGLYLDPDRTGVAPPWQMPDEAEELRACQRYWQKLGDAAVQAVGAGIQYTTTQAQLHVPYLAQMRSLPAVTMPAGSLQMRTIGAAATVTSITPYPGLASMLVDAVATGLTGGHGTVARLINNNAPAFLLNARM